MSVYVLLHTVVPRLLRAKVDRHNWGPTTSYYLWPPSLPGYSSLYINYDLQSLIEAFNCVVLVLNTFGENRARLRRVASQSHHVPQQNKFSTQNNISQNDFSQNNFSTQNTFPQTTGPNCGHEPTIFSSSSRGEVLARAHHRKGSLHRSVEKGFCCVTSRSCGYWIWSTPQANRHRMSSHTIDTSLSVNTHHSHISLEFWTRTVTDGLTTTVHMTYQTQDHCISYGVHMELVIWVYDVYPNTYG